MSQDTLRIIATSNEGTCQEYNWRKWLYWTPPRPLSLIYLSIFYCANTIETSYVACFLHSHHHFHYTILTLQYRLQIKLPYLFLPILGPLYIEKHICSRNWNTRYHLVHSGRHSDKISMLGKVVPLISPSINIFNQI